ncbi:MAG: EAL domain-containing protein, partial [Arcobacter sp.]|nr:EAL domain-containing protein [Arcobacter sp.]
NLKTIAEFVENEDIFKITKSLGATYSQGYFFSPPVAKPTIYSFKNAI